MSLKDALFTRVFTLRNLFVAGNALLLLLFLAAVVKDHRREWKGHQKKFYSQEVRRLNEALATAAPEEKDRIAKKLHLVKSQSVKLRQIIVPGMDRFDRCVTCHLGYDPLLSPAGETEYAEHPFSAKPNDVHRAHPVEKFGCTVCHEGQGLATTARAAHGPVKHWEKPLHRGVYLQAACAKCHSNLHDEKAMPFTGAWRRGETLFKELGCIGCHQIRGQGGPVSVDLAEETSDKPLSRIDWSHTGLAHEERTLAEWIRLHLATDPWTLVPGDPEGKHNEEPIAPSGMPFFQLSDADARAVTTYILAMAKDQIPSALVVPSAPRPEPVYRGAVERGRAVYVKFGCGGCHAPDGSGGIRNFNYQGGTEPNLRKLMGTYKREELREKLEKGVAVVAKADPKGPTPPLYMPSWKEKIKGQELDDLMTYLFSIAEKTEEW